MDLAIIIYLSSCEMNQLAEAAYLILKIYKKIILWVEKGLRHKALKHLTIYLETPCTTHCYWHSMFT